ncbi:MAG: hypothetical protein JXR50_11385 [Prolixibacteraceae bacterium]|nr:hypothetical protein [Prolixibacteraceae bacterium]MBN2650331.1 hypothetical protein [Prolixibacteraceae bacterium]
MKLKSRFILLFLSILTAFTLMGIYTHSSFVKIKHIEDTNNQVQHLKSLILELNNHKNEYNNWDLSSTDYFQYGKSENIKNFELSYNEAIKTTNSLNKNPFIVEINSQKNINEIKNQLESYHAAFAKYQQHKKEFGFKDWGVIGNMREAIHNVETEVNNMSLLKLKVHMLMLRRHEKDYLLRRDIAYSDKFMSEYLAFTGSIEQIALSSSKKEQLKTLLDQYQTTFLSLIEKDHIIGTTQTKGMTADINKKSRQLNASITSLNQLISAKTKRYIHQTIFFLIIFIVLCTAASIGLGLFIFRGITRMMGGEPEEVEQIAKQISKGNLNLDLGSHKEYRGMMKSVVRMAEQLSKIITGIHKNAEQLAITSRQYSKSAQTISEGSFNQASSIDEISASIEEITSTIGQNTLHALETGNLAAQVKTDVMNIKSQSDKSLETGKMIEDKIKIINTIANQTTILALNAAVEAARSGKNGQGFQVIAEEVKRLAQISRDAAKEINLFTSQNACQIGEVTKLVSNILTPIEQTSTNVRNIATTSGEMENGTTQVNISVNQLYNISQENAAASQEMAAGSVELEKRAHELINMVSYFNLNAVNLSKQPRKKKKKKTRKIALHQDTNPQNELIRV